MLKYLLCALLLFAEGLFAAGFEIHLNDHAIDNNEIDYRRTARMAMDAQGDVVVMYCKNNPDEDLIGVYIESWGTTHNSVWHVVPDYSIGERPNPSVHCIGDTIFFVCSSDPSDDGSIYFGYYDAGAFSYDTVIADADIGGVDGEPGVFKAGDVLAAYWTTDDGGTDSVAVSVARTGLPVSDNWPIIWANTANYNNGWTCPISDEGTPWGLVRFGNGLNEEMFLIDTIGYTELADPFINHTSVIDQEAFVMVDSDGVFICQASTSSGSDSIFVFTFRVTDQTGSAGLTYLGDTTVLATAAEVTDAVNHYPIVQHLVGTDTVIAYYRYNNGSNYDIAYHISGDKGVTWGSRLTFRAGDGRGVWDLHVPLKLHKNGDGDIIGYASYTSTEGGNNDSIYVWCDTIYEAGGATPETNNTQIIIIGEADEEDDFTSPICTAAMRFWLR